MNNTFKRFQGLPYNIVLFPGLRISEQLSIVSEKYFILIGHFRYNVDENLDFGKLVEAIHDNLSKHDIFGNNGN